MDYPAQPAGTDQDKKRRLFLQQKETLDTFLRNGAITRAQYDKSFGDLVVKMGMRESDYSPQEGKTTSGGKPDADVHPE